jgi:hypothetical protein
MQPLAAARTAEAPLPGGGTLVAVDELVELEDVDLADV